MCVSANVHYHLLHGSKASTEYSKDAMLGQHAPAAARRNRWLRELLVLNSGHQRVEEQRAAEEGAARAAADRALQREEEAARLADPAVVAWLRAGAQAATHWCHRTPLTREQRQARLQGKQFMEEEAAPELSQFYYY